MKDKAHKVYGNKHYVICPRCKSIMEVFNTADLIKALCHNCEFRLFFVLKDAMIKDINTHIIYSDIFITKDEYKKNNKVKKK